LLKGLCQFAQKYLQAGESMKTMAGACYGVLDSVGGQFLLIVIAYVDFGGAARQQFFCAGKLAFN